MNRSTINTNLIKFKPFFRINLVFPHIGKKLDLLWGSTAFDDYVRHLLTDTRDGTRQGFPKAAVEDLYKIISYHDKMHTHLRDEVDPESKLFRYDSWGMAR